MLIKNTDLLDNFKNLLVKIENADKDKEANFDDCILLEKYAKEIVDRRLMSEKNVMKYVLQAQGIDMMKQISNKTLCFYCLGCNKLEDEEFEGLMRCENIIPSKRNWQEEWKKNLESEEE